LRLAAGEPLGYGPDAVATRGWAMMCRVKAQDPARHYLPSPGHLRRVRLPGGPEVRVDTYLYCDSEVPSFYDPLIATITVWAADRPACIGRLRRALEDFTLIGAPTNLPLLLHLIGRPEFVIGQYTTDILRDVNDIALAPADETMRRHLAAAVALLYVRRREAFAPQLSDRLATGWHRAGRHLQ
jgi:acetyl-CoA carboxylase biotin carboxylase subunit